jgi:hypothetical protein
MHSKERNGIRYYYRSVRQNGKPATEYVGSGPLAELKVRFEQAYRQQQSEEAATWRQEKQVLDVEEQQRAGWFDATEAIVHGVLAAAGFHRHRRGHWRKRRMNDKAKLPATITKEVMPDPPIPVAEINELIRQSKEGDKAARRRIRELTELEPIGMLRATGGCLAWQIESAKISKLTGDDKMWDSAITHKMRSIRESLGGPDAPPLERLLIERIALAWLDVSDLDFRHASSADLSYAKAEYFSRMRDRANRRYLQALKTLAQVRKLNVVAINVEVDKMQVNVGVDPPASKS